MCPSVDKSRRAGGLRLIKSLVADLQYQLRIHAREGIVENDFSSDDLEASIATGTVVKTQKDEMEESIGNKKYTIVGAAICGRPLYSVGKIMQDQDGKHYRFITIKCDEGSHG